MDMIPYRLEQVEKRYDAMDARMGRVEERLGEIQVTIVQSSNNQLAAFEAGLSAIQAVAAAHSLPAAPEQK
jgi:hypothetical protein